MKEKNIKRLTVIAILTVVLLQLVWLSNTYFLIRKDIIENSNSILNEAIKREVLSRFVNLQDSMPEGTILGTGEIEDSGERASDIPILNEAFLRFGSKISLTNLDSIYTTLLQTANIQAKTIINITNNKDSIIESTHKGYQPFWGVIKTNPIPILINESEKIQAIIINPYWAILQKMILLLIATAIMMAFIGSCIAYQIRIITRQKKIAEIKETFSYAMIHDMKTPIGSLQLGCHILRRLQPDNTEKKEKYLTIMEEESEHLYSLANRVLTIAKLEKDSLLLNKSIIALKPMINDLIEKFTAKASKSVVFTTCFNINQVYADKEYLKEALSNLIDNAIKYSRNAVKIDITCNEKEDYIQISIKDNGLGIGMKDMEKIFEKFKRTSKAIKRQRQGGPAGFGLGLNYVKQVIEAHDGKIDIQSKEGKYSNFIINLPKLTEEL